MDDDQNNNELLLVELTKRIMSHSEYFSRMLELIPPFAYFSQQQNQSNKSYSTDVQSYKLTTKNKKLAKFDPENYQSVPKILEEQYKKAKGEDEEKEIKTENGKMEDIVPGFVATIAEREELKRRLREKVNAMRAKRNAPPLTDDPENKSLEPPAKRFKVEERRKEKLKNSKKKKNKSVSPNKVVAIPKIQQKQSDDTTIEFATFDFSSGAPVPTYLQNKRKPSKNFLLKQVQEKKKKFQELQGTEEGDALVKQDAWASMKKKAQGEKVKNDVEKLKKSIKREQHQKKKSKKEWDTRIGAQKKSQITAQKKRAENIAAAK